MVAAEAIHELCVRRIKARPVLVERSADEKSTFPCATHELKQLYGTSLSFRRYQKKLVADDEGFEADPVADEEIAAQAGELSEIEDKVDSGSVHDNVRN